MVKSPFLRRFNNSLDVLKPIGSIGSGIGYASQIIDSSVKIHNGEGSLSGQIAYQAVGRPLLEKSIIGVAAGSVDFVGNIALNIAGSEHELKVEDTMLKMFEDTFDPVARDSRQDKMFESLSDTDIRCIADPESCNMNWFESNLFILGELYRDRG
jgi:hypothetical protein